jgi:hypothetical protein
MQRIEKENKTLEKFENKKERVIESMSNATGTGCPTLSAAVVSIMPANCSCNSGYSLKNASGQVAGPGVTGPYTCKQ